MSKKIILSAATIISLVGLSSTAFASTWGNYNLINVGCATSGWCHAELTTDVLSSATCTNRRRVYWNPTTMATDSMTSVMMSAYLSGKRVRLFASDSTCRTFEDTSDTGVVISVARIRD